MAIIKLLTKTTAAQNEDALSYQSARVIFSGSYFFGDYIYISLLLQTLIRCKFPLTNTQN